VIERKEGGPEKLRRNADRDQGKIKQDRIQCPDQDDCCPIKNGDQGLDRLRGDIMNDEEEKQKGQASSPSKMIR